jgi:hypothetical protein
MCSFLCDVHCFYTLRKVVDKNRRKIKQKTAVFQSYFFDAGIGNTVVICSYIRGSSRYNSTPTTNVNLPLIVKIDLAFFYRLLIDFPAYISTYLFLSLLFFFGRKINCVIRAISQSNADS